MKRYLLLLIFALFAFSVKAQEDGKAKAILDAMSNKYQNLSAYKVNFVYTLENRMENMREEYSGEIVVKGDKYKLILGEQMVLNNGETVWTYFEDVNEVNIEEFMPEDGEMTPVTIYDAYKDGYKYKFIEQKKEGAKTINIVELQPEKDSDAFEDLIKIKLAIDASDNTLSSMEIYDRTGSVFSYDMSGFNPRPNVTDAAFSFDVDNYPGVEVVDLR